MFVPSRSLSISPNWHCSNQYSAVWLHALRLITRGMWTAVASFKTLLKDNGARAIACLSEGVVFSRLHSILRPRLGGFLALAIAVSDGFQNLGHDGFHLQSLTLIHLVIHRKHFQAIFIHRIVCGLTKR